MTRRNPPIGQDSSVDYGTGVVTLGQEDAYVLPEMEASVRRVAVEPLSGKRLPILDPASGEILGFTGSKTLKPDWMIDPKRKGEYFDPGETLKVLEGLGRGRWPKTKKQERIAGQIEQALYMDAETEKALASGGGEYEPTEGTRDEGREPEFLSSLEFSRPRVQVDLKGRTFTLGKRSPYRGKIAMVNPTGRMWRVEIYSPGAPRPSRVFSRLSESDAKTLTQRVLAQAHNLGWNVRVRATEDNGNPSVGENVVLMFGSQARQTLAWNTLKRAGIHWGSVRYKEVRGTFPWRIEVRGDHRGILSTLFPRMAKNPLTRRETAGVLRGARQDLRIARSKPVDTPARAYGLGRADLGRMLAYQYGGAKLPAARGRILRGQVWMMNPLTRLESAALVRDSRRQRRYSRDVLHTGDATHAAFLRGYAGAEEDVAYHYLPSSLQHPKGRPLYPKRWKEHYQYPNPPRVIGTIPGRMTRIEYQRTGAHPGRYYHNFKPGVSARVLSDGSVLLQGPRRLHVKE